jgi:low temperature requirement protein LtrA
MLSRDPTEEHRAASPLELFFDLCFVVAVAQAGDRLHHALAEGRVGEGVLAYAMVFFAIWWAWMNITWFASAYDTDDGPYRLLTLVQISGALILAAGVPRAFDLGDFGVVTLGYVVMRVALVSQWLRAAYSDPPGRRTALRFAVGVTVVQVGWVGLLALPEDQYHIGWLVLATAELAVPIWAEHARSTAWHPGHIAERFGLFTIIVLGEAVLAASLTIQSALDAGRATPQLITVVAGGLLTVFAMWWLYFAKPARLLLRSNRSAFPWGYGHLVIFASAAAVGAGLAVLVDQVTGGVHLSRTEAAATVTVPVALYLLTVWLLHLRPHHRGDRAPRDPGHRRVDPDGDRGRPGRPRDRRAHGCAGGRFTRYGLAQLRRISRTRGRHGRTEGGRVDREASSASLRLHVSRRCGLVTQIPQAKPLACCDVPKDLDKVPRPPAHGNVPRGPRSDRIHDRLTILLCTQDDDAQPGKALRNGVDPFEISHSGQLDIQ